jgi:uncharacterized membrane protein YphA (DoxX/SURF4 family)
VVADTQAWVEERRPAAKKAVQSALDHARDVRNSRSLGEARGKLRSVLRQTREVRAAVRRCWSSHSRVSGALQPLERFAQSLGRVLVTLFFFNQAWESRGLYRYYSEQLRAAGGTSSGLYVPSYPWGSVLFVAPAALLCALGVRTRAAAGLLTLDMVREDAVLVYRGLVALVANGMRPNELMVKKTAILGCAALVFVGAGKERTSSSMAGGLTDDDAPPLPSRRKSAALLVGRLLMAALFLYVGSGQVARIRHRAELWSHKVDPTDGHDNNWLILELALSLPFAAGYRTRHVSLALAGTLVLEALTAWPFWRFRSEAAAGAWALGKFIHARSHFVTNLSVAGGLLLLSGLGAGRFTVDNLLAKKKE